MDGTGRLVTLDEAVARFAAALQPLRTADTEDVALEGALDRVLAQDAVAPTDLPPFDRSLVDGWAVKADGRTLLPVGAEVRMGGPAEPLPPGTAAVMPTGGMMPPGADAVVMREEARVVSGSVVFRNPAVAGANVIQRGADARRGDVVVPADRRLRPFEVAMLAAAGVAGLKVRRRPRVAILSTGDELDAPPALPGDGRVPDANGPALAAALRRDGCAPVFLGVVPDDRNAVRAALREGLDHDGMICTGGSSVGERDFVQAALEEVLGVPPLFSGITVRPGRPTAAFAAGSTWAVALPGHTVSALVVYEFLLRDAMRRLGGEARPPARGWAEAELAEGVRAPADRELLARVRLEGEGGPFRAKPLAGPSAAVGSLALADGLVRCPPRTALAAGTLVRVLLLD